MKNIFMLIAVLAAMIAMPLNGTSQVQVNNHDDYFKGGASTNSEANVIKLGLFHFWCGEGPLFYERKINDKLSVEGCAGITFNYLMRDLVNDVDNSPFLVNDETGIDAITYSPGYVLKADLRFYPGGEMPEGWYVSPQLRYKVYNITYKNILTSPQSSTTYYGSGGVDYPSYLKYFDIMAVGGYQVLGESGLSVDIYAGVGLRSRAYEMPTLNPYTAGYGISANYYTFKPKNDAVIYIPFGLLFGFAFD